MQTWAIVVAAGGGSRFGAAKQFARLGGVSVLDRAVGVARESCDGVVVVVPAAGDWVAPDGVQVAIGGATRSASVRAGLACVPESADVVVVHDAARPLASRALFARVVAAVRAGADAAVPAMPVTDTVKRVRDDVVVETVARDDLVTVQTPQAFRRSALDAAHAGDGVGTDDAALVEAAGGRVVVVEGESRNLKLTLVDDLELAQALIEGAHA
ncbi:MAG TPA: 2-C-methyl-D-erythritol 4-phosphate cytidylyltransferase [Acidimicrobiia bacterium]|nr:2-C-methyl-D-erythritol 4-phosphate cytidylyltransferase [Acidimicrobiia bacterium]